MFFILKVRLPASSLCPGQLNPRTGGPDVSHFIETKVCEDPVPSTSIGTISLRHLLPWCLCYIFSNNVFLSLLSGPAMPHLGS